MSFPFDKKLTTKNITAGKNTKQFLILHHTGGGSFESNCNVLTNWSVSCHFVVWQNGETAKIWEPDDILWHAWDSLWGDLKMMNSYSMGIEFVDVNGKFTNKQFNKWVELITHLMRAFGLRKENILTHAMITNWQKSIDKKNRAPGDKSRKVDVNPSFRQDRWFDNYASFVSRLDWIVYWF